MRKPLPVVSGVPGVNAPKPKNFDEFYAFYLSHYLWEKNKPALSYGLMPFVWAIGCDFRQAFGYYTGRLTRDVNEVRAALRLTPAQITLADAPELTTAA